MKIDQLLKQVIHHDDVIKWNNFPVTGNLWGELSGQFPAQRPVTGNFDAFFDLRRNIIGWVNNDKAGDLRRNRAHYDVTVMHCFVTYAI